MKFTDTMSERRPTHRKRLVWTVGAVLVVALALSLGATLLVRSSRRYRAELAQAEREFNAGHFALTRQRLTDLESLWPGEAEVKFRLGICELARGRREEALAAWARVPADSVFAARAAALRGHQLTSAGRYAPAEDILESALRGAGADAPEVLKALIRLYRFEGRTDGVRQRLRESLAWSLVPAEVLKELWTLDTTSWAMEAWQLALDKADPDDDRVWLGQANLATLTGRYRDAGERFEECLKRRPDDPAVWRGRLRLARAAEDVEGAWAALSHLPAGSVAEDEVYALRAWLTGRRGDPEAERAALTTLLEHDPGNASALERLAALASNSGRVEEARRWRLRKAELDRTAHRYRLIVLYEVDLARRAGELATLSTTLGRRFDARAWSLLSARDGSGRGPIGPVLVEADRPTPPKARNLGTLADLWRDLRPAPTRPPRPGGPDATPPVFTDGAEAAGLRFQFDSGQTPLREVPEIMSGGVAVLDYDGDGWLDVYAVQGGPFAANSPRPDSDHLFRNLGDGTFRDVTTESAIASFPRGYGLGAAVGDYDNDGDPDLFVSRLRSYALYRNRGDGTFEDVTAAAGLGGVRDNPSSAAFADLDGDGDLDLYVSHYMVYDPAHPRLCPKDDSHGVMMYCDPSKLDPAPDHVFRNDGGRFIDVTAAAGFVDPDGRGLGVIAADLDDDGKIDLFVANDGTANYLFRNLGGFRFEEVGHAAGVAASGIGGYQASMGVACGDLDGDGRPDLAVTNFYGEAMTFYRNMGRGLFTDRTADSGLSAATRYLLGFGTAFLDYDNDGRLDLMSANGHVNDNRPYTPFAMPAQLLAGDGKGRLADVSAQAGPPWSVLRVGRGLAVGDLDNDGRVDALLVAQNEPLAYFHNRTRGGHFLTLRLEGTASNRDGVGATVTVTAGGRRQVAQRCGGGSYQSSSDPRLHFGLGTASAVDAVEVHWPSGRIDTFSHLPTGTGHLLREGADAPAPLKGFARP